MPQQVRATQRVDRISVVAQISIQRKTRFQPCQGGQLGLGGAEIAACGVQGQKQAAWRHEVGTLRDGALGRDGRLVKAVVGNACLLYTSPSPRD